MRICDPAVSRTVRLLMRVTEYRRHRVALGLVIAGCAGSVQPVVDNARFEEIIEEFGLAPLPAIPYPDDNGFEPARVSLGRLLFFDPILGGESAPRVKVAAGRDPYTYRANDVACATCHFPSLGFTDRRRISAGVGGAQFGDLALGPDRVVPARSLVTGAELGIVARNAPTILNAGLNGRDSPQSVASSFQFYDGRVMGGLEQQAMLPVVSRDEMMGDAFLGSAAGTVRDSLAARVREIPEYVTHFQQAFASEVSAAGDITFDHIAHALAAYQRELITPGSDYDRFVAGDFEALTEDEREGFLLFFEEGRCGVCHTGPMLSDYSFRVLGVAEAYDLAQPGFAGRNGMGGDFGRYHADPVLLDNFKFAFRVQTIRNVEVTDPYFHSGSAATLRDVLDFYNRGGRGDGDLSDEQLAAEGVVRDSDIVRLGLTSVQMDRLVDFLKTTTAPVQTLAGVPELASAPPRVPSGLLPSGVTTPPGPGPFFR